MLIRKRWPKVLAAGLALCAFWASGSAQPASQSYLRQDSARFVVLYTQQDAAAVSGFWSVIRDNLPVVERRLRLELADTVAFVIAPNAREWARLTQGAPLWANGLAYPQRGVAVLKSPALGARYGPLATTALHEYVHLLLHAGAPNADFPRWLDEGLAQVAAQQLEYVDGHLLARAVAFGRLHSFSRLEGLMSMSEPEAQLGYAESAVAAEFLESRYGPAGVANLVHEVRRGREFEAAFLSLFGSSVGAFESDYQDFVRRKYRFSFLADTDLWVPAAFVILVLAAGVAVWMRRRRTVARWKEEDRRDAARPEEAGAPPYTVDYTIIRDRLHGPRDSDDQGLPHDRPTPGN